MIRRLGLLLLGVVVVAVVVLMRPAPPAACYGEWRNARLTTFSSFPDPGTAECIDFNGCAWAGQFYGLRGTHSEDWVAARNIAAVHEKDWESLGMKRLRLRQDARDITVDVIDICADSDCNGCCTANLGGDGYLIDLEKSTMERFGSGSGIVAFQVCD